MSENYETEDGQYIVTRYVGPYKKGMMVQINDRYAEEDTGEYSSIPLTVLLDALVELFPKLSLPKR